VGKGEGMKGEYVISEWVKASMYTMSNEQWTMDNERTVSARTVSAEGRGSLKQSTPKASKKGCRLSGDRKLWVCVGVQKKSGVWGVYA
jgi:hypothetical protein